MTREHPELPAALLTETAPATLDGLFDARVRQTPQAEACRWFCADRQQWQSLTWGELDARVASFAAGLHALALPAGARVALMLDNGPDWLAAEQAIYRLGLVSVGIYVQDTPGNAAQLLAHSGASVLFARDAALWQAVRGVQPLPALRAVVLMQGRGQPDSPGAGGSTTCTLEELLVSGAGVVPPGAVSAPQALASLVYTSGTCGSAKGAMLSHGALVANVRALEQAFGQAGSTDGVVKLSLLPLSHSFERVAGWHHAVWVGAVTVFSRGPEHLMEDFATVRPTAFLGVPRLYERLYAGLSRALLQGPLPQRALFHLARSGQVPTGTARRFSARLAQPLVQDIRQRFGGRLRFAISGGAPLAPDLARAFAALGLPLLQGYGLTEAGPVVSVQRPGSADAESAGLPLDGVETCIAPDGELLVRSPSLMQGYWRDDQATARALDANGWLHTGDKASRLSAPALVLTGRLKDVLVTSTGVKACPAEIEARLTADPLFEQALVLGESRPYLVALLVPEPAAFAALAASLAVDGQPPDAIALEAALLERCRGCLQSLPKSHQLRRVASVAPFTLANGLATSTLKPRRTQIAKTHATLIESLYDGHCRAYKSDCACNAELARDAGTP